MKLLNEVRKHTEKVIDYLYKTLNEISKKPRTYRKIARKNYLSVAKCRRPKRKQIRKAIKKQLQYIRRNLSHIDKLINEGASLETLSRRQHKKLLVAAEIYRQQLSMYENKSKRIDDRIVSLSQPHIRPIMRGKARQTTEFGAKIVVSCIEKYVLLDKISWDNFNESGDLKSQIEKYKELTGFYPESVHVDKIYRSQSNRKWCKERGIRLSGPPLGRPPKNISKETKIQAKIDENIRNRIEAKFGQAKRRYTLNLVMSKLPQTSETSIAITFLVMNLSAVLRQIICLFCPYLKNSSFFPRSIIKNYILTTKNNFKLSFNAG